jgi:hypothetical protein
LSIYGELALDAAGHGDRASADRWIEAGRARDPVPERSARAMEWQMLDIQIQASFDEPDQWVPNLVTALERARNNAEAMNVVVRKLIELGLIRATPDPYHPEQVALDTRLLEQFVSQYGPKIATPAGEPAAAASRGAIWTPQTSAGAGGTIWTPGTGAPRPASEPRKLIVPGQ